MAAGLIVDLNTEAQMLVSLNSPPVLSGSFLAAGSGTIIGQSCDMLHADTFTNLFAAGVSQSGQLRLQVQVSDSDTSGNYTDPTSGLAQFPTIFQSGGIVWINSGGAGGGIYGAQASGYSEASGFMAAAGFQRIGRFARVNMLSEASAQFAGPLQAGFIGQFRTTGSGGGFSYSPSSGTVNV